jgi:hypothetical protein
VKERKVMKHQLESRSPKYRMGTDIPQTLDGICVILEVGRISS